MRLELPRPIVTILVNVLANLGLQEPSVTLVTLPMGTLELTVTNAYQIGT